MAELTPVSDEPDADVECSECNAVFFLMWRRDGCTEGASFCPFCGDEIERRKTPESDSVRKLTMSDVIYSPTWESDCGEVKLWLGDCLEVMAGWPDGAVDAVVTDPPYGCGKADWDSEFPVVWYTAAKRVARSIAIITGSAGLPDSLALVGSDYIDTIAARNLNGMTRGPIGFGNWLACVVAGQKPPPGVNAFDFVVRGNMPSHPSPKPVAYMERLLRRLGWPSVADPFMGSGTTGVAAVRLGRQFWGVEIDPEYFEIAKKRIQDELRRVNFLEPQRVKERQAALFSDEE